VRRIAIIGSGGAGKSVLARRVGRRLDLPVTHLDVLFWRPGWVEMSQDEWRGVQEQLVAGGAWVIDGNHAPTLDVRLSRADTVVLVDLPRRICLWRAVNRSVDYRFKPRADRADGCRERLDRAFLRFVWTYPKVWRPNALAAIAAWAPHAEVIQLRTPRQIERWLKSLPEPMAEPAPAETPAPRAAQEGNATPPPPAPLPRRPPRRRVSGTTTRA
jgi:adenylate kinase family enzyme